MNALYKVIMKNGANKRLSIEVLGQNKMNAVYNARSILTGATIQFNNNPIYKDFIINESVEKIEHTEAPQNEGEWCKCDKCNGYGQIAMFMQYHGGVCYKCGGLGVVRKSKDAYIKLL